MRIASLTVALGTELAGFRAGFASALSDVKRFAQQMAGVKVANPLAGAVPQINKPAMVAAARNAVSALREAFDAEKILLQQHAASGLISPARFRVEGVKSAEAFNKGVLSEISKLEASGFIGPKLRAELVSTLEKIGHDSGAAFKREIEQSLAAAGESALARVGDKLRTAGRALTAAITVPLGAVAAAGIKFAAAAQENFAQFERFFGGAAARTTVALKALTQIIPRTTDDLQAMATQVQAALLPLGILPDVAADMSVTLVKLAADMSVLRKSTPEQELETLRLALLGNTRGLRSFNIALDEGNIGAAAVALGISKTGKELTAQQRALTIYAALLEKTALVQGLSGDAAGRFGGSLKLMRASLQEAAETIGSVLLPALLPVVRAVTSAARAFAALPESVRKNIVIFGALAFALGPVLTVLGGLLIGLAKFGAIIGIMKTFGLTMGTIGALLAPGGLVILGLGLLATTLGIVAFHAIKAAIETANLKSELQKLSKEKLQVNADELFLNLQRLEREKRALIDKPVPLFTFNPLGARRDVQRLQALNAEIAETNKQLGLIAQIKAAPAITATSDAAGELAALLKGFGEGMDIFSGSLASGQSALAKFAEQSNRLVDRFKELRAEGQPARNVALQIVAAFSAAETSVAKLGDRLDDDAVALRRVFGELRAVAGEALRISLAPAEPQRIKFVPFVDTSPAAITAMVLELQATGKTRFSVNFTPTLDSSPTAISGMVQNLMSSTTPAQRTIQFLTKLQPPSGSDLRNFQDQVDRVVQQKGLLDLAILTGDKAFQQSAAEEFDRAHQQALTTLANLATAVKQVNIPFAAQRILLLQIAAIAAKLPAPFKEVASSSAKFITAGRGLTQIAAGFTNINREVLAVVGSILDAVGAVEQFNKAKKDKDVLGQISGALGVAGAAVSFGAAIAELMFGAARRAQKELADVLRKNSEEIASLNVTLKGFRGTFGDQAALLKNLISALPAAQRLADARPIFGLNRVDLTPIRVAQADFIAAIAATGFTLTELSQIAKGWGITLLDSSGRIIPQAIGDLVRYLETARLAVFRFENTLDDVTLATRLRNAAAGIEGTPERILTDSLQDFKKLAPAIFEQFFSSINFANGLSASELADIRRQSQALVEAFLTEALNPDLLLGFKSPEEFAQFMLTWIEALNGMTNAANEVTRSLVNVPEGFKIDRARFNATIAQTTEAIRATFDQFDPNKTGKLQGATLAARQTVTVTNNFDIEIAGSSKSGAQLFSEISVEAKRLVKAKSPSLPASAAFDL